MTLNVKNKSVAPPAKAPIPQPRPETPAASAAPALGGDSLSLGAAPPPATVEVGEGDTLSAIAERVLGDPNRWNEIFEANRDRLRDPHRLRVGMTLRLPGAPPETAPIPQPRPERLEDKICPYVPGQTSSEQLAQLLNEVRKIADEPDATYTVRRGDSLSGIASRLLGDAGRWNEILEANRDQLDRPEGLQPGMVLKIPDGAKEVLRPRAPERGEEGPVQAGALWDLAREMGRRHNVDSRLVMAVIQKESGGNPRARSPVGARGLMQLMPGTARDLGVTDSYNARQNVEAGTRYLKQMLDQFGDVRLALMAYNWGPGNVRQYLRGRKRPPKETRDYVPAVLAYFRQFGGRA